MENINFKPRIRCLQNKT